MHRLNARTLDIQYDQLNGTSVVADFRVVADNPTRLEAEAVSDLQVRWESSVLAVL